MYCRKCGNELPENAAFCGKCGAPTNQKAGNAAGNLSKKRKVSRKKVFIGVAAASVVFIGIILAVVIGIGNRSANDETNGQTVDGSGETSGQYIQIVATESMNPTDYQWLMTRTDTYDGESNFLGCSTYAYSESNKQIKWEMFNADYSLNTRQEYTYDDLDRIIQNRTWDSEGNLVKSSDRIYEGDLTQPTEVVWYNEDGSVKYSNRYSYLPEYDKTDIVWEYNADGEAVNYKEFSFDNEGNYTGYRYCYPDGSLYETCVYTYDEAGNMVANEKFDKDNEIKESNSFQYIDGNEVSYQKRNGEDELLVWNTMEYDYAGNEIVRYYYNSDGELLNTVVSAYEPVWDCDVTAIEHENGEYLYESQTPIEEFCLWFGQEKMNEVNSERVVSKTENKNFPIKARITINETDTYSIEIASVMEKLSFQDGVTVNSIKLEILDEAGNTVRDEQLLPNMYLFGQFEEVAEVEGDTEAEPEEEQYYLATKTICDNSYNSKEIYEYNSNGNLSSHIKYLSDGTVSFEEKYNDEGNIVSYYDRNGRREEWEYDHEGKAIRFITDEYVGEWEYDSSGKAISYITYNTINGRKGEKVLSIANWEYDSSGNLIRETGLGGHGEKYTWEYDSSGNIIYKETVFEYGHISNSTVQIEYDSYGNKVSEKKSYPNNPVNDSQKKWAWEYDGNGNKIKCISYSDSGSIESIKTWEYEYDNNGNLLKEVECEYSESGEAEITEVFYEYKTL